MGDSDFNFKPPDDSKWTGGTWILFMLTIGIPILIFIATNDGPWYDALLP